MTGDNKCPHCGKELVSYPARFGYEAITVHRETFDDLCADGRAMVREYFAKHHHFRPVLSEARP